MERPQAIRFGRLNNGIYRCTGIGAMRCVAEQPVFSSNGKGTYRTLRPVIRQLQPSVQKYIHQPVPLIQGISQRRTKHTFWYGIFLLFLSHPGKKFFCHRSGAFHPGEKIFPEKKVPVLRNLLPDGTAYCSTPDRLELESVPGYPSEAFSMYP